MKRGGSGGRSRCGQGRRRHSGASGVESWRSRREGFECDVLRVVNQRASACTAKACLCYRVPVEVERRRRATVQATVKPAIVGCGDRGRLRRPQRQSVILITGKCRHGLSNASRSQMPAIRKWSLASRF